MSKASNYAVGTKVILTGERGSRDVRQEWEVVENLGDRGLVVKRNGRTARTGEGCTTWRSNGPKCVTLMRNTTITKLS